MPLRKMFTIMGFAVLLPLFAACGTIGGFGEDMEAAGEGIQEEAE